MREQPKVVAFDVIETVFSLELLRKRLAAVGLTGEALDIWFARVLRDAFALEVTGIYQSFREVASAALTGLLAERGCRADPSDVEEVLEGLTALEPHPDAREAFAALRDAGIRLITLTNGSAEITQTLLGRAGLDRFVEQVISISDLRHWKPREEVYLHAARRTGVEPAQMGLVAAHPWDVHGAARAGLAAVFVARGRPFPRFMAQPAITAASLRDAAKALLLLPEVRVSPDNGSS